TTVKTVSVNFYEGNVRASAAGPDDALVQTDNHKTNNITSVGITNRRSSTFFVGLQGDEKADFSYNYAQDGTTVKTVSVNFYEGNVRASAAGPDDALVQTDNHKTSNITSVGITNRRSSTFFVGLQGDEKADFSYNYAQDGTTVKTVSVNFYEGNVRASAAGPDDALVQT